MITRNPILIIVYCLSCIGISVFTLSAFTQIIRQYLAVNYEYQMELVAVTGQVGFQWFFMWSCTWGQRIQYMLVALSVSMIGSLILLPLVYYSEIATVSAVNALGYFVGVVLVIFVIHHLLIVKNRLPGMLSLTWILYRALLLVFLVYPR